MKDHFEKIDKEILEAIGRSAEDIDVPERLRPENIGKLLKKEDGTDETISQDSDNVVSFRQKKHFNWRRVISAAAVAAVALIAIPVGVANQNMTVSVEESTMPEAYQQDIEDTMVAAADGAAIGATETTEKRISLKKAFKGYFYTEASVEDAAKKLEKLNKEKEKYGIGRFYKTAEDGMAINEAAAEESMDNGSSNPAAGAAGSVAGAAGKHEYSETNLREMGVDEGDIVKTDGEYIYAMSNSGTVRIIKADGDKLTLSCSFEPEYEDADDYELKDMYISGDKLILVSDTYTVFFKNRIYDTEDVMAPDSADSGDAGTSEKTKDGYTVQNEDKTIVAVYDMQDRTSPKKTGDYSVDGNYQSSRIADGMIYLFTWYREGNIPVICGEMPSHKCIYIPKERDFYQAFTMTSVALDNPGKRVDAKVIYSSCNDVYVTNDTVILEVPEYTGSHDVTNLFKFNINAGKFSPAGVAAVPGYIESGFSIDEDSDKNIRVATTTWGYSRSSSGVYVFDRYMKRIGKLTGIAKGEEIQSARFLDDILYLVTYENKDPLFSIDLSDPAKPTIIGKLDIPGFSDYLHFWDDTHLLGIGYDSDEKNGEILGAKLSLFDISDPKKVKEVANTVIKGIDQIDGMYNYRALLVNPGKNIIGFNTTDWDYSDDFKETHKYYVFSLNDDLSKFNKQAEIKTYEDDGWEDVRGLFIDDTFYIVTGRNIRSFDMKADYKQGETVIKF